MTTMGALLAAVALAGSPSEPLLYVRLKTGDSKLSVQQLSRAVDRPICVSSDGGENVLHARVTRPLLGKLADHRIDVHPEPALNILTLPNGVPLKLTHRGIAPNAKTREKTSSPRQWLVYAPGKELVPPAVLAALQEGSELPVYDVDCFGAYEAIDITWMMTDEQARRLAALPFVDALAPLEWFHKVSPALLGLGSDVDEKTLASTARHFVGEDTPRRLRVGALGPPEAAWQEMKAFGDVEFLRLEEDGTLIVRIPTAKIPLLAALPEVISLFPDDLTAVN